MVIVPWCLSSRSVHGSVMSFVPQCLWLYLYGVFGRAVSMVTQSVALVFIVQCCLWLHSLWP